jgi:hypothetical protein
MCTLIWLCPQAFTKLAGQRQGHNPNYKPEVMCNKYIAMIHVFVLLISNHEMLIFWFACASCFNFQVPFKLDKDKDTPVQKYITAPVQKYIT